MNTTHASKLLVFAAIISLSACAGPKEPSFGEKIQNESVATKTIGKQWIKGDVLTQEGLELIEEGKRDVSKAKKLDNKGQNKIEKGEKLIKKGSALKETAENDYNASLALENNKNISGAYQPY